MALEMDKIIEAEKASEERITYAKKKTSAELTAANEELQARIRKANESMKVLVVEVTEKGRQEAFFEAEKLASVQSQKITLLRSSAQDKSEKAIKMIIEAF